MKSGGVIIDVSKEGCFFCLSFLKVSGKTRPGGLEGFDDTDPGCLFAARRRDLNLIYLP
jgi:hypothetical protein